MTTLLSWLSVDARGPSSIYIVTDSRITWGSAQRRWDSGRKVFGTQSADIFGYCGDVLFPSLVLGQISDLADRGVLWDRASKAIERHTVLLDYLQSSSARRHNSPDQDFTVIHAARDGAEMESTFHAWRVDYEAKHRHWSDTKLDTGPAANSLLVLALGSGAAALKKEVAAWNATPQGGTARALFSAFCDALASAADPLSGGVPQLVSIDRRSPGKVIGFVAEGVRYIHGLPVKYMAGMEALEWVDALFQRTSPSSLRLLSGAQKHARVEKPVKGGFSEFMRRTSVGETSPKPDGSKSD